MRAAAFARNAWGRSYHFLKASDKRTKRSGAAFIFALIWAVTLKFWVEMPIENRGKMTLMASRVYRRVGPAKLLLFALALSLTFHSALTAAGHLRTIRTIGDVHGMSNVEAKRGYPVVVEGTATYSDPEWGLLFLQNRTGGVYIDVHGTGIQIAPGTRVRLHAVTAPGDVEPVISRAKIETLSRGSRLAPEQFSVAELNSGTADSRLVMTHGVLRSGVQQFNRICFRIIDGAASVLVIIPQPESVLSTRLIGATVRVQGVSASHLDKAGKRVGAQIFASSLNDIEMEQPAIANPLSSPTQPIRTIEISDADQRFVHAVHVRGLVIWHQPGLLWVEDESGSICVRAGSDAVHLGENVDVVGFPSRADYGLTLSDAVVRKVAGSSSMGKVPAASVYAGQILSQGMNGKRVRLDALLIQQTANPEEDVLHVAQGNLRFSATMLKSSSAQEMVRIPPNSMLELTGLALARAATAKRPASLVILVESPAFIVARQGYGGLTLMKVLGILCSVIVGVGLILVWVTQLRRTVRRQTATIRGKLEREMQLESQYRRLFERNLAGVFRWRPEGEIFDCNLAFAKMLGYEAANEIIGRSYWDFQVQKTEEGETTLLAAGDALSNRDAKFVRRDGTLVCLLENMTAVETSAGTVYETTAIDVTQLRRNQAELRRARDAAVSQSLSDPLNWAPKPSADG